MNEVFLKVGNVLPVLQTIISGNGVAIDLSTSTGAYFIYRSRLNQTGVSTRVQGTITGTNTVQYNWTTGDVATVGPYYGEWNIYAATNQIRTFPQDKYLNFELVSGLL